MKINYKLINIEQISYKDALFLQKLLQEKVVKDSSEQYIIALTHNDVITTGKRGFLDNLNHDIEFYNSNNIELVKTDRGGLTTFHGKGQLVIYFILSLLDLKLGVKSFVSKLESAIISSLKKIDIIATTKDGKRGIFVKDDKICAIGLNISHNVTSHGIALNVTTDLDKFNLFTPCGLKDVGVTSLEKLNKDSSLNDIKEIILEEITKELNITTN